MKAKTGVAIWTALVMVAIAGTFVYREYLRLRAPIPTLTSPIVYEIRQGTTLSAVLRELRKRDIVEHPLAVSWWLRLTRRGYTLKAGEYELTPNMSPIDVVNLFNSGKVVQHRLRFKEGITAKEFRKLLADEKLLDPKTRDLSDGALMKQLGSEYAHPEGWFFPETYSFTKGAPDLQVLRDAHQRMLRELERIWTGREPGLPLASPYEALILASIVEKETGLASERPRIAGVFVERLRKGMRLETDPTVIYGLGDAYDGNIRTADLRRDGPYNTRTRAGLPPTPICLPSADALQAVVHPEITGALFFMASPSNDGSHYFSKTYDEHKAAVQRYLKANRRR